MSEVNPLPNGWVRASVRDVLAPPTGWNPGGAETATIKYVDIEAVDNKRQRIGAPKEIPISGLPSRARVGIKSGDVLFSLVRPYLKNIARVPQDLDGHVASTAFVSLRPASGMHTDFLFYQLTQDNFIKAIPTYGNSPPAARDEEFLDMQIPVAPPAEQQRIAAKIEELLSDLDAGVSALEHSRANLKRYRAAVLKAAVEGRLTEKWRAAHPGVETAEKLLERILAERRKKWEEAQLKKFAEKKQAPPKGWKEKYSEPVKPEVAGLPKLPEGWCWATVDQVSVSIRYGSSAKTQEELNGVPVLRMGNIQDGRIDLSRLKHLPKKHEEFPELFLEPGDVLFNRTNSPELVGKTAVYKGNPNPCSYASYLIGIRSVIGWEPDILAYFINSSLGRAWIASVVSQQVGQANVNGTKLAALAFPLPPAREQREVVKSVEEQISSLDQTGKDSEALIVRSARLRQSILKRAFEGKLVPQDPTDEPAGELLARIRAERAAQSVVGRGRGKIRKKIRQKTSE